MKTKKNQSLVQKRTAQQWKLHQQLAQFIKNLDRLPDAGEARLNSPLSAPPDLLPMVF